MARPGPAIEPAGRPAALASGVQVRVQRTGKTLPPSRRLLWAGLALAGSFVLQAGGLAAAAVRAAVVIGTSEAPANSSEPTDATMISSRLRELGFSTMLVENPNGADLKALAGAMRLHLAGADLKFLYVAGRILPAQRQNVLLPSDGKETTEDQVRASGTPLGDLLAAADDGGRGALVVVLNPGRRPQPRAGMNVLQRVEMHRPNTIVAYAQTPQEAMAEDAAGTGDAYATALANALLASEVKLPDVFRDVRRDVREATKGSLLPVVEGAWQTTVALAKPKVAEETEKLPAPTLDDVLWATVRNSADESDLDAFAEAFPTSRYRERALARRVRLASGMEAGIGPLVQTVARRASPLEGLDISAEYLLATTGDRAPPRPLRTWPRRLPGTRDGLAHLTTRCDELAADPDDPMRVAPGVRWEVMNQHAAVRTCSIDLVRSPGNRRLLFQLGRALDASGQYDWAEYYYKQAMEQGYSAAVANLAYMHMTGRGRPINMTEAIRLLRIGAEMGNPRTRTDLAKSYLRGSGVDKSESEALLWLRLAGSGGWPNAIDILGNLYADGRGVEKDEAIAVELYSTAAWIGNTNAMVNLGRAYLDGRGVKRDQSAAKTWLERSAAAGNPFASFFLGQMYIWGAGVPKSVPRAVELYMTSANRGFGQARYELGQLYEKGAAGVPVNLRTAAFHYSLADRTTYEMPVSADILAAARARLADVNRRLSVADREEVDRRVKEWLLLNGF